MAKVLLVDDSRSSRMIIEKVVKKLGHEVIGQAEDGEKGFEAYKELKPDLVLSDVEMPNLDGHGMVKRIIEFDPDASIAMVTSVVNAQFIKKIISEGALYAVKKPINEEKLKKIFDQLDWEWEFYLRVSSKIDDTII